MSKYQVFTIMETEVILSLLIEGKLHEDQIKRHSNECV